MAASREFEHEDAEHLAAVAAGIQSLAKGVGERFGGGPIRQTVVEMRSAYLLVTVAGQGACLAVLSTEEADIGLIAYEMAMLVTGLGHHLSAAHVRRSRPSDVSQALRRRRTRHDRRGARRAEVDDTLVRGGTVAR